MFKAIGFYAFFPPVQKAHRDEPVPTPLHFAFMKVGTRDLNAPAWVVIVAHDVNQALPLTKHEKPSRE